MENQETPAKEKGLGPIVVLATARCAQARTIEEVLTHRGYRVLGRRLGYEARLIEIHKSRKAIVFADSSMAQSPPTQAAVTFAAQRNNAFLIGEDALLQQASGLPSSLGLWTGEKAPEAALDAITAWLGAPPSIGLPLDRRAFVFAGGAVIAGAGLVVAVTRPWEQLDAAMAPSARHALLMGVSNYRDPAWRSLPNALRDCDSVRAELDKIGFTTRDVVRDPDLAGMRAAVESFARSDASSSGALALIYIAAHGIHLNNMSYIIGADGPSTADLSLSAATNSLRLDLATRYLAVGDLVAHYQTRFSMLMLVLDACRANDVHTPAVRGEGAGRPPQQENASAPRAKVLYSAAQGQLALDGSPEGNSPFALAFISALDKPGVTTGMIARPVSRGLERLTNNQQWTEDVNVGSANYFLNVPQPLLPRFNAAPSR